MASVASKQNSRAMNLSLSTGVLMLIAKWIAFGLTGSSVIFSDAAESVVHIVAVWFAWYALRVGRVSFLSAGVEGGLICIAAIVIIVSAVDKLIVGVEIQKLEFGIMIIAGAALVNLALGLHLIRTGKSNRSLVVEANGRHVMTDVWTSAGAVVGLLIAQWTGLYWLDPIIAILFGANIIREGGNLLLVSVRGLMDTADPVLLRSTQKIIDEYCQANDCTSHRLRLRTSGNLVHIDYHLLVPDDMRMQDAHNLATQLEERVRIGLDGNVEVFTHLESFSQPEGHV
ncbi:MAG: cation diffusion facilitator family transporter [Candidatus Kapabacteria bacterium]|nr:cation diffusion facilitator family transporter [Candidatus Kapabacteria bacterium]